MLSRKLVSASGVLMCWVPMVVAGDAPDSKSDSAVLKYTMKNIDGQDVSLSDYKGDVLLIVNVASRCGYTPQYKDLEILYRKYKDRGFKVLAFPANNFGGQEPGPNKEIKEFCQSKYDVTFDLFAKVSVTGDDICDLYKTLTDRKQVGKYGGKIRWNFQKFLVDRQGAVVGRFDPSDNPMGAKVVKAIEAALGGSSGSAAAPDQPAGR